MTDYLHELVTAVKKLAVELERTPTRAELEKSITGGNYKLAKVGGFSIVLQAAGLQPYNERRKKVKITNEIFEVDLEKHLASYKPRPTYEQKPFPTAAIISDIHWPFESNKVVSKFYSYVAENKPTWVIINGDAWDMYSFSKYPRSHNIFMPKDEERMAREKNVKFWKEIQRLSPGSKCVQMMGNHDIRALKRALEVLPAAYDWIAEKLKELFTFDNVTTIMDPREELMLRDDIAVFHGYQTRMGAHRDYTLISCFVGHTHKGGTVFRSLANGAQIWECNSGVAGDPESKGLSYTSQKIHNMTPGFSALDKYGPRFIPV